MVFTGTGSRGCVWRSSLFVYRCCARARGRASAVPASCRRERLRRMEAAEGTEVRARGRKEPEPTADTAAKARAAGDAQCGPPLSGTSYWLDFWLFILFDVLLFVFFYLLP